jgi:hypothetical protein
MHQKDDFFTEKFPCGASQEIVAGTWQQAVQAGLRWNGRVCMTRPVHGGKDKRPVLLLLAEDRLGEQNSPRTGSGGGGWAVNVSGQCPYIS